MFASKKTAAPSGETVYIESVFSTYLYAGNGTSQTITNGIDLSTYGGLVWVKNRSAAWGHVLSRQAQYWMSSNTTAAENTADATAVSSYNSNGFSVGSRVQVNNSAENFVSWTFRKQAKFFDVVTYTGDGVNGRTISHNLGSTPGCIIVKKTNAASTYGWCVYHRGCSGTFNLMFNSTEAQGTTFNGEITSPTSTTFTVSSLGDVNGSGATFVAYLFAHDAGGFGLTGTDNVISCGSFTTGAGSSFTAVNLGYEPQWLLIKASSGTSNWSLIDNMRGIPVGSNGARLVPNLADAETATFSWANLTATGFEQPTGGTNPYSPSTTYIYIAIRRGPMKVPTSGTSVFSPVARTGTSAAATISGVGFAPDFAAIKARSTNSNNTWIDKLRGAVRLQSDTTNAEDSYPSGITSWNNGGISLGAAGHVNGSPETFINYLFQRAPSFFDVVVVTTNGQASAITSTHNLGVAPEMMIAKKRGPTSGVGDWMVYHKGLNGGVTPQNYRIRLNSTSGEGTGAAVWNNTAPTATQFTIGTDGDVNSGTAGDRTVFYIFATCPGVSKVGSYTGTGTTKQIDCGFTAGARFVLIKRTDSTGDWYVWDTARGIVSGNDPYLLLNSTAAEVTNTDYIDPINSGFEISSTAPAAINANGGTFIFLAIA
jgi:hypothetical protein